jgi:SEC-C motif-containing protein
MTKNELCPCGSNTPYSKCCEQILNDHSLATTAESLMRSRYTAFVQKHDSHLLRSWHSRTRPKSLNHDDFPVVWLGMEIHGCEKGGIEDHAGTVDFTTHYIENGQLSHLREKSEFLKEDQLWYYLKGTAEIKKEKLERNKPCPCGSGKKFKRCCLTL